jgi:hypothetical protein
MPTWVRPPASSVDDSRRPMPIEISLLALGSMFWPVLLAVDVVAFKTDRPSGLSADSSPAAWSRPSRSAARSSSHSRTRLSSAGRGTRPTQPSRSPSARRRWSPRPSFAEATVPERGLALAEPGATRADSAQTASIETGLSDGTLSSLTWRRCCGRTCEDGRHPLRGLLSGARVAGPNARVELTPDELRAAAGSGRCARAVHDAPVARRARGRRDGRACSRTSRPKLAARSNGGGRREGVRLAGSACAEPAGPAATLRRRTAQGSSREIQVLVPPGLELCVSNP